MYKSLFGYFGFRTNIFKMSKIQDRTEGYQKVNWSTYKKSHDQFLIELRRSKRLANFHKKRHSETCVVESMSTDECDLTFTLQELLTPNTQFTQENVLLIMQTLKSYLQSTQIATVEEALNTVKSLMNYSSETLKFLSEYGIFIYVIKLITPISPPIILEKSAWILSDFLATEHSKFLIDTTLVTTLINSLSQSEQSISQHLLWALGNISAEEDFQQLLILKSPLIKALGNFVESSSKTVAWILSNLSKGAELMDLGQKRTVCELVSVLFKCEDIEILTECLEALNNLSTDEDLETIQTIVDNGLVHVTVSTLRIENLLVRTPALKILGNVCAASHEHTQLVMNMNLLDIICDKEFIFSTLSSDTIWILSNIAAGTKSQVDKLMSHKIFNSLILSIVHYEMKTRVQAIIAVKNLLKAEESCKEKLAKMDFFSVLNMALKETDADYCKILIEVCKIMFLDKRFLKLIEETGCMFALEALSMHKNTEISSGVEELIQLLTILNKP